MGFWETFAYSILMRLCTIWITCLFILWIFHANYGENLFIDFFFWVLSPLLFLFYGLKHFLSSFYCVIFVWFYFNWITWKRWWWIKGIAQQKIKSYTVVIDPVTKYYDFSALNFFFFYNFIDWKVLYIFPSSLFRFWNEL